ncbi:MAG TPA: sulfatase-like hydrolase/transferase [Polyangiaceae bacterium]|nr:sulfatase-like hydrolase/transferase [Polyangiaceae bacterium]
MSLRSRRVVAYLVDAATVIAAWAGLFVAETVTLGFLQREQFSGIWEIAGARRAVVPLAVLGSVPAAFVAALGWRLALARSAPARWTVRLSGAFAGAALGFGVSGGRHFATAGLRAWFVVALAVLGAVMTAHLAVHVARLRRHPLALALLGLGLAVGAWVGDAYVLPRLYPAFHLALFATTLLGGALVAFAARGEAKAPEILQVAVAAIVALGLVRWGVGVPRDLADLDRLANLRFVLVEHAPLLGRAVSLATRLKAPDPGGIAVASAATTATTPGEIARSLEWSGHDLLLLTVDALRADHVSGYGYRRATTPNIDALAREGALFENAYCPTPHTSYSISSMMTGKYMRPLLSMGLGEDSETWPQYLRRYGWRTAAFYPPAVFYIDENRFSRLERERLGFEYSKVEFADPTLREKQVAEYLASATPDRALFLWVHFFEPHEPYVMHPDHPFSGGASTDLDAYDSEVATADDGIGRIVRLVRAMRPGTAVIVTADHGEEFGEHGGRYHGTSVYEEQVRVPLVVVGPGVRPGIRIPTVVQTIDLLPTSLSALGIPRPARLRGRDLGPILAGGGHADNDGFAFAETDDYALVAKGDDRLVCQRRAAACALYRPAEDPLERHDLASQDDRANVLRALLRATERDHGRYEASAAAAWPEALRRGLQGEAEAAPDVASLLDDADVAIRRKAAEVCFGLASPTTVAQLRRAVNRDEDDDVRRWAALALARIGEPPSPVVEVLLHDEKREWRRAAALALAQHEDARACPEIAAWWDEAAPASPGGEGAPRQLSIDLSRTRELLDATRKARCRSALPALLRALDDVRARPFVSDTLGGLGDVRARAALLDHLADEPYLTTRTHEARALLALGASDWAAETPAGEVDAPLTISPGATSAVVLLTDPDATLTVTIDRTPAPSEFFEGAVRILELPAVSDRARRVHFELHTSTGGAVALWFARRPAD